MKSKLISIFLFTVIAFTNAVPSFAQAPSASASPVASVAPTVAPAIPSESASDFFTQVLQAIQGFGGLSTLAKVTAIVALIIASMKVSFLNNLIWSRLGVFKNLVAPALGLLAGVIGLFGHGSSVTLASLFAYLAAGVGASGVHEVLDGLKAIPGLGTGYVAAINAIEGMLGGGQPAPVATVEIDNQTPKS